MRFAAILAFEDLRRLIEGLAYGRQPREQREANELDALQRVDQIEDYIRELEAGAGRQNAGG